MNITTRQAQYNDIDEVSALYDALNDHLAATINYPCWSRDRYPTRADAHRFWSSGALYIAESDNRIAGAIAITKEPEPEPISGSWLVDADDQDVFVLHALAVHPQFMRTGIAGALMRFAEDEAILRGIKSVRLDVYEHNAPAIKAYEGLGYKFIGMVDLDKGERGLDLFRLYEKPIQGAAPHDDQELRRFLQGPDRGRVLDGHGQ